MLLQSIADKVAGLRKESLGEGKFVHLVNRLGELMEYVLQSLTMCRQK